MNKEIQLSVVIPVINEHDSIRDTIISLHNNVPVLFEIIIIFDFDEDSTVPVIENMKDEYNNLRLLKNKICVGPSGAIRYGIKSALAPYILVTMGDLSDDHTQINEMLQLIKSEADILCPSRYCSGGIQDISSSYKKWPPLIAGNILHYLVGLPYDPTNSYKLYSKRIFDALELKSTSSFSVTLEIITKSHLHGYRILEIPTVWKDRIIGKSNFKIWRSIFTYLPWFLLALVPKKLFSLSKSISRSLFIKN